MDLNNIMDMMIMVEEYSIYVQEMSEKKEHVQQKVV